MKNLFTHYEVDPELEINGAWITFDSGAKVKLARHGHDAHKQLLEQLQRPYRTFGLSGRKVPDDVMDDIVTRGMVECIIKDWDPSTMIGEDNKPTPYSKDNAYKFMRDKRLREFRLEMIAASMQIEFFRKQILQEAAGNSESTSPGLAATATAAQ